MKPPFLAFSSYSETSDQPTMLLHHGAHPFISAPQ
jgi:hypothetical protein